MAGNEHWTAAQMRHYMATGEEPGAGPAQKEKKKPSKMGNKITVIDGIKFSSQLEAAHYLDLMYRKQVGAIKRFHRQVAFDLPGGVRYICDFMVINDDDSIDYLDSKGRRLPQFIDKQKQVKALYGVDIIEVTKRDIPQCYIDSARELNEMPGANK